MTNFRFRTQGGITGLLIVLFSLLLILACNKDKQKSAESLPGQEWLADMRENVEKTVDEPETKSQLMDLIDQEEKILRELYQTATRFFTDLKATDREYDATEDDFRKILSEYNTNRTALRDRSIEIRFKMHALVSPHQWENLADISKRKGLFKQAWQSPTLEYTKGGEK